MYDSACESSKVPDLLTKAYWTFRLNYRIIVKSTHSTNFQNINNPNPSLFSTILINVLKFTYKLFFWLFFLLSI